MDTTTIIIMVIALFEIGLLITGSVYMANLAGGPDTSNQISAKIIPVVAIMGVIVFLHTILWYMYHSINSADMTMYFLISTSFSLLLSFTALGVSIANSS